MLSVGSCSRDRAKGISRAVRALVLTRARAGGKSRVGRNPTGSRNRGTSHHVSEAWEHVGGSREIVLGGWSQILKGGAGKSRLDLEGG